MGRGIKMESDYLYITKFFVGDFEQVVGITRSENGYVKIDEDLRDDVLIQLSNEQVVDIKYLHDNYDIIGGMQLYEGGYNCICAFELDDAELYLVDKLELLNVRSYTEDDKWVSKNNIIWNSLDGDVRFFGSSTRPYGAHGLANGASCLTHMFLHDKYVDRRGDHMLMDLYVSGTKYGEIARILVGVEQKHVARARLFYV